MLLINNMVKIFDDELMQCLQRLHSLCCVCVSRPPTQYWYSAEERFLYLLNITHETECFIVI